MRQKAAWVFFFWGTMMFSQVSISGKLTDEKGNPVIGASIVINKAETDEIIVYDISDIEGAYTITFNSQEKTVDFQIRNIAYKTIKTNVDVKNQIRDFILEEETTVLKEIIVKSLPITKRGDTINYSVNAFSKEQDRSIADVLKRLPGIEVLSSGKILYQGKPINKYYIEGLDLLGGKYNLANENLPYKEVAKIQVLENHQPIRVLDSLQFSDEAALNIKLKNKYTLTGQASLGAGGAPLLWHSNITPILFTKREQLLISYQANNTGDNIATQLKTLTIEDLLIQAEDDSGKQDWLGIQQLRTPSFSEERWLDNNTHLLSGNYLRKIKKDFEIRLNISYLNDYQQQRGSTNTLFFTANDTISLFENKHNQHYFNSLETDLVLQKNTNKNYFKNNIQFQGSWNSQQGNIQTNDTSITQNLSNHYFKLSNNLKTIFPIGKQLVTLSSLVRFSNAPQSLVVNPGQFENLLNNDTPFNEVIQQIDLKTFYANNYIGFTKAWKRFNFSPRIGLKFERQNLQSDITSDTQDLSGELKNDLDWTLSKFYFDTQIQYTRNKWRVESSIPLNLNSYTIEDQQLQRGEDLNRLTFEPRLSVIYDINAFWKFNTSIIFGNKFGTIDQLHYAYILKNYRNIQRINTPLPQLLNQTFAGGVSYRNPIKSLFLSAVYTQNNSETNLLYQNEILQDGTTELQAIERENNRTSHNISTRISKYIGEVDTNISLNASLGVQTFQRILNNEITDIENQNLSVGGKFETDFTDWFNAEYKASLLFSKNQIQDQSNNTITQQSHLINLNFYPNESQNLSVKTEYVRNSLFSENINNLFANVLYRYTWKKKNLDFELQFSNIFNTQNYRTININEFSYLETNFRLRPRQLLFKVRFSL